MERFITDNKGQNCKVQTYDNPDGSFELRIKYESRRAGDAVSSIRQKGNLVLENIHIWDYNDPCDNRSPASIFGSNGTTGRAMNFRGRGLGTKLLKLFIDCARDRGLKRIYGSIMEKDISKTPHLIDWYKKYGFRECEPYKGHVPGAKIYICLELR